MAGSPGLYPEQWIKALECEGYRSINFPAERAHELGQQIVLAESDGVVRQEESLKQVTIASHQADDETLRGKGIRYFKKLLGGVLKIKSEDLDAATPLGEYGIDSIMIGQIWKYSRNFVIRGEDDRCVGGSFSRS
jgi:hypothetical protein